MFTQTINATGKRVIAFNDIHGEFDLLNFALDSLKVTKNDVVISVGDMIDRGPKSYQTVDTFLYEENFFPVLGNHELLFLSGYLNNNAHDHATSVANGGLWHTQYHRREMEHLGRRLLSWVPKALLVKFGSKKIAFTHADIPKDEFWLLNESDTKTMLWNHEAIKENRRILDIDLAVHGHKTVTLPTLVGNRAFIDTNSNFKHVADEDEIERGFMTALVIEEGKVEAVHFAESLLGKRYMVLLGDNHNFNTACSDLLAN
ncbi:metallophosphoesterase [Vibrio barjaei]|uniref:metallophosphoesterase n=1 Tax=Vibrio barjaei TaxID=1676683 RepID=UPI0022842D2C|nr:metallophosphoesterase [Vibrio barjaei]MCY9872384.1 metallophosphoesterase [Vibrio barjaei]